MDSKYYFNGSFYGLQKLPSTMSKNLLKSFLKQSEKLPLYGLRKPLSLVLASRARAILVH